MLLANFSLANKLQSLEMTYDAMGFMQKVERASVSQIKMTGVLQIMCVQYYDLSAETRKILTPCPDVYSALCCGETRYF
jgi:hypothetical protein